MLGVGNTAEVFEYGEGKVCKLFFAGYPKDAVEREYRNAKEVYRLGLPVPAVYETVVLEGRNGIVYEKIAGKSMLEGVFENPGEAYVYLEHFVRLQKKWLKEASVQSASVLSYKEYLNVLIKGDGPVVEASLIDEIKDLPEGDTLLHGDFHPGNILITQDKRTVVIDFMNVCRGPALYDIARTYLLLKEKDEAFGRAYLAKSEVSEDEIAAFYRVIEKCRRYEIYGK